MSTSKVVEVRSKTNKINTKLKFQLEVNTKFGEEVFLFGSSKKLGNWEQNQALKLNYIRPKLWSLDLEYETTEKLEYQYFIKKDDELTFESGIRILQNLSSTKQNSILIQDVFNKPNFPENNFNTSLFTNVFPKKKENKNAFTKTKQYHFKIQVPLFYPSLSLGIIGNISELGNWSENLFLPLKRSSNNEWNLSIDFKEVNHPIEYKYVIFESKGNKLLAYEAGDNRVLYPAEGDSKLLINDAYFQYPKNFLPKLAGISIPVFSLKSQNSCGVGEFLDLIPFADWANDCGLRMIQILPINDTTANYSWTDSYPYAAISVFALHPIYTNLEAIKFKKSDGFEKIYGDKQNTLNAIDQVDYESVIDYKIENLRWIYDLNEDKILTNKNFKNFIDTHKTWLLDYAAFCTLRDENGTPEFDNWSSFNKYNSTKVKAFFKKENQRFSTVHFWCFVQWQLHEQLKQATDYLKSKKIAFKGDIPIGIYRNSADAWSQPELFNMNMQAGAPPDDFSVVGQNWEFPTYNWQRMAEDEFDWWKKRFKHLENYFDTFRIDHILGFFRIWQIPMHATQGILGYFEPALPFTVQELNDWGMWYDENRLTKPFLTAEIIRSYFGESAEKVLNDFFEHGAHGLQFKSFYSTQKKLSKNRPEEDWIFEKLLELHANVIFIKEENEDKLHPRFNLFNTTSYQNLGEHEQRVLKEIHDQYFYKRHEEFWRKKGMEKLPKLKEATNMLVCGEDLGLVPKVVPQVLDDLGILSLQIQRMPSEQNKLFSNPTEANYWTVVSPSSHDTSTLRLWWEENRENTQHFYNHLLGQWGQAPEQLNSYLVHQILAQHFNSDALLAIAPLQDYLALTESTTWEQKDKERINIPSVFPHYWRYRMHLSIEELQRNNELNQTVKKLIQSAGRSN